MSENNSNNLIEQLGQIMQNDSIPSEIKNLFNNLNNSSNNSNKSNNSSSSNQSFTSNNNSENSNDNNDDQSPEIDINTILKMKQLIDSMNSNKNDPRANLLTSLKPYLKESRQKKVDQYIKLFGLGKALETFNILGNDNNPGGDNHDTK